MIDYVVVNDELLRFLVDFNIDMFDQCLSDVYCPMRFKLHFNNPLAKKFDVVVNQSPNDKSEASYHTAVAWSSDKIPDYVTQISEETIYVLICHLFPKMLPKNASIHSALELNNTMLNAANVAGISKKIKTRKN